MLKVFSNQLRRVHKQVENLLQNPSMGNSENGLFRVGEYYLKNKMYSQARYVFSRYLTYYPSGKLVDQASRYLEAAEQTLSRYGDGKGPALFANIDQTGSTPAPKAQPEQKAASNDDQGVAKKYYDTISLLNQGKAKEAFTAFKALAESDSTDTDFRNKALFDMGRCLIALSQWDGVIKHYTGLIQLVPKHESMPDMLFYMGQAYEKKNENDRALGFYKKALAMETDDDAPIHIKAKKAIQALGGA
jgi:TolA-binding protein